MRFRLGIMVAIGLSLAAGGCHSKSQEADDLDALYAQAKAAGFPTTWEEDSPRPKGKSEDNGAKQLLPAMLSIIERAGPEAEFGSQLATWRKDGLPRVEQTRILAAVSSDLTQVRAALNKPYIDFERDPDLGPAVKFPETGGIKTTVQILCLSADMRAESGDAAGALSEYQDAVKLESILRPSRFLIYMLVDVAVRTYLDIGLRHLASHFVDKPDALRSLAKIEAELPSSIDFAEVLKKESYMGLSSCRNLKAMGGVDALLAAEKGDLSAGNPWPSGDKSSRTGLPSDRESRAELSAVLKLYLDLVAVVADAKLDRDDKVARLDQIGKAVDRSTSRDSKMAQEIVPLMAPCYLASESIKGNAAVEQAFLGVMIYRASHGKFPKNLAQAGLKISDPFYGGPLTYIVTGNGFKVQSPGLEMLGSDVKDSQGNPLRRKFELDYP